MANERLRAAITQAGLDPNALADLIEVDIKTVQRWLSGRTPYTRHRAKLVKALGREQHELWPELPPAPADDGSSQEEIHGVWAHCDDDGAPDWRSLLDDAIAQIELLDYSLLDIISAAGVIDTLAAKAALGCQVRILISAPDSIWVSAAAEQLGQQRDYIGRSELQLEIETARGHLERLIQRDGVEVREFYTHPGYRILRFDEQMLVTPHLYATSVHDAPMLQLPRRAAGGVFDQFADHLDAIARDTSQAIQPAPDLYPDPLAQPDRYAPLTAETYGQELDRAQQRHQQLLDRQRPIERVRAELRRPEQPTNPAGE